MIARIRDTDGRIIVIAGAIAGVRAAIDLAESRGAKVIGDVEFSESPLDGEAETTPDGIGNDLCATHGR